ncbi:MAG TPA: sugar ABC transporter ATP-binding protein [Clostridia bacterium]|nr:sugar ABC transporter ATP-binding protein [Clostridia bacterium]
MGIKLLELKGINKAFYGVKALNDVDFSIEAGESRCLIGENGCGKSTLIKIISGFYTHDSGDIFINGKHCKKISPMESIKEGIQIIYQDFSLFPNMTVAENITMNSFLSQNRKMVNWKEMKDMAQKSLDNLRITIDLNALVGDLNVAQKQLVAIARAILQDAKLIIMDEPTTALTYKEIISLYNIVEELHKKGIAVLFVSHKLDEVLTISQKITVLRNGMNVFDGDAKDLSKRELIYYITGKEIEAEPYIFELKDEKSLMEVKNLSLTNHFSNVSFNLMPGEILGITGLLGCGRTELAKSLFGLMPASSGEIFVNGVRTRMESVQDAIKSNIGYVPEDRLTEGLHMEQTIGENSVICIIDKLLGKIKNLDKNKMKLQMEKGLNSIKIEGMAYDKQAKSLSGGNQQKVVLVKWLAANPKILILNCPTVGVDVGSKSEIHEVIKNLAKTGIGIIVISDDIPEILMICNRIMVMNQGNVVSEVLSTETTIEELERKLIEEYIYA